MTAEGALRDSVPSDEPRQRVASALRERREAALLQHPSVRRMAELLAEKCRELSWVRTAVATLDRFAALTGVQDLEGLLGEGRRDPLMAETSLRQLAAALDGRAPEQVAALAFGAKVWWRTNGVPVPWRPLTEQANQAAPIPLRAPSGLPTLALIGSGLTADELATVRVGDLGALDERGRFLADPLAEPLVVQYRDARDRREWISFLTPAVREAALKRIAELGGLGGVDPATPLVDPGDVAAAGARDAALIGAGNDINVTLCRATGDFFRTWGMPGARFGERLRVVGSRGYPAESHTISPTERRTR
ncbi:MAG: hypothetical protein H0V49_10865 [Nocardioidaceae bacterium]|nr:hypothetical protein [Nocardioidaceae bacterium]